MEPTNWTQIGGLAAAGAAGAVLSRLFQGRNPRDRGPGPRGFKARLGAVGKLLFKGAASTAVPEIADKLGKGHGPVTGAAVKIARGAFEQWPPRPDEVAPGDGGGGSTGVGAAQELELGELWGKATGETGDPDTLANRALEHFNAYHGWNVRRVRDLDPDMFYFMRWMLKRQIESGVKLTWKQFNDLNRTSSTSFNLAPYTSPTPANPSTTTTPPTQPPPTT